MEDNLSSGSDNKLPLIVGIGAIGVAVLALALAFKAKSDAKTATAALEEIKSSYATKADIDTVRAGTAKASDVQAVDGKLEEFKGQVTTNFNTLAGTVNEQNKLLQGIAKKPVAPNGDKAGNGKTAAPVAGEGEYLVKGGDTGMKIAKANGVSIKALTEANPGVNFSKLHVGQKIKLPTAKK